ncbi:MAG TPA: hypothetical protein VE954_06800 [Oligoflexus sp.]|uniref:hypothetical protein n=1 Tax=Oligoflexus sp. TaxID=1971216 RepID=UPI002D5E801D|nr:hypothetical protein [Oligoflexus sp.]HYX32805.1 hypothetical protein [Oligoflexus sp.]
MKSTVFAAALLGMGTESHAVIQGLYGSECLHVEGLSAYKDMAFDKDTLKQVQTVFGDNECSLPAYDFVFEGPYRIDEQLGYIDYSFDTIRLTPLSEGVAENFNQYGLCGITSWTAGKAEHVAGLNCGGQQIPNLNTFVYDRIVDNRNGIQMGRASEDLNGSTPNHRPDEVDDVIYHAK